jgi:hypothetical protein
MPLPKWQCNATIRFSGCGVNHILGGCPGRAARTQGTFRRRACRSLLRPRPARVTIANVPKSACRCATLSRIL